MRSFSLQLFSWIHTMRILTNDSKMWLILVAILTLISWHISPSLSSSSTTNQHHHQQHIDEFVSLNEFTLYNGSTFSLSNIHRSSEPALSLIFHGAKILPKKEKVNSTTRKFTFDDQSLMFLSLKQLSRHNVTEYYFHWKGGGGRNWGREVCVFYGSGNWYNTYQSPHPKWPMDTQRILPTLYFNYLHDWRSSKSEFVHILEHIFVSTDGFALLLDPHQPLFIRRDPNHGSPLLCFSVNNTEPYSSLNDPAYLDIKIRVLSSTNIRTVIDYVIRESGFVPKLESTPDSRLFSQPYWKLSGEEKSRMLSDKVPEFVNRLQEYSLDKGEIIIDDGWRNADFTLNTNTMPHFDQMLSTLHNRGLRLTARTIPDVLRNTLHTEKYFIKNKMGHKVDYVDFSNGQACGWFEALLRKLHFDEGIDSFYLSSKTFAPGFQVHDKHAQLHPNGLITRYVDTAAGQHHPTTSTSTTTSTTITSTTEVAFKNQNVPVFVQLWNNLNFATPAHLLQSLIPSVLSVSLGGYAFVVPYAIGQGAEAPTEEQYIRWVQATALMPRMSFHVPPMSYGSRCIGLTKKYIDFHTKYQEIFAGLATKRVQTGAPIIRPMWYAEPDDAQAYSIDDQFMLGDDIVVAPVLVEGQTSREVYLPGGLWVDALGQSYRGPRTWTLAAPLETLLYFKRQ